AALPARPRRPLRAPASSRGWGSGRRPGERPAAHWRRRRVLRLLPQQVGERSLHERRDDALDRPLGLRIAQHQRRRQADDRVAVERPVEDEAALERAAREAGRGRGLGELEPEEEAQAAGGDEAAPPDERAQALEQAGAEPRGTRWKVFAQEHLERREARRARE